MQRNHHEDDKSLLPLFDGWEQKMYYDISENQLNLANNLELVNTNIKNIIQSEKLFTFREVLTDLTEKCLLKLTFEVDKARENDDINENIFFIIGHITEDEDLIKAFKDKIFKSIESEQRARDWRAEVCCNIEVFDQSTNLLEALKCIVELHIEKYLTSIYYILEKNTAFRSYFTDEDEEHSSKIKEIWLEIFNGLQIQGLELQSLSQSNYTTFISNLKFPFSRIEYDILKELVNDQNNFENESEEQMLTPLEHFA